MGSRLYAGNLPYSSTENQLNDLFSRAGKVSSVRVMRDMATGRARGLAFVEMASEEDARKAIASFNDYKLEGRPLVVDEAKPRPEGGRFEGNQDPAAVEYRAGSAAALYSSTIQPSRRLMTRLP